MRPYDSIILTDSLRDDLPVGTRGTVVDTYPQTDTVLIVECFDRDGATLDVVDVRSDQMMVTLADFHGGEQVALLADLPQQKLWRGQVGTVQERVGVGLYSVDFADTTGVLNVRLTLHAGQLMLLRGLALQTVQSA